MKNVFLVLFIGLATQLLADPNELVGNLEDGTKLILKKQILIPANSDRVHLQLGEIVHFVQGCKTYCDLVLTSPNSQSRVLKAGTVFVVGSEQNKYFETPTFRSPITVNKITCIGEVEFCKSHQDLAGAIEVVKTFGRIGSLEKDLKGLFEIIYPESEVQ